MRIRSNETLRLVGISLLAVGVAAVPRAVAAQEKTARGTVAAMAGNSLTVTVATTNMKFSVDQKTTVVAQGAGTSARKAQDAGQTGPRLADVVKPGQAVIITYRENGSTLYASRVEAVSSAGAGGGSISTPAPPTRSSTGTVKSVSGSSLTITADGADVTFAVDSSTSVIAKGAGTKAAAGGGKVAITDLLIWRLARRRSMP